jgi:DNA-binding response OmpR family regulator
MTGETYRILLAEDDRFLRKAAETTLKRSGFEVTTATDGEEALRAVGTCNPHLVLLDLIMPKVQGFEVLKSLKADAATAGIPVIVLSNLGQERDVQRALEGGAAAYLVKANLSLEELVKRVRETLGLAEAPRPVAAAGSRVGPWAKP